MAITQQRAALSDLPLSSVFLRLKLFRLCHLPLLGSPQLGSLRLPFVVEENGKGNRVVALEVFELRPMQKRILAVLLGDGFALYESKASVLEPSSDLPIKTPVGYS